VSSHSQMDLKLFLLVSRMPEPSGAQLQSRDGLNVILGNVHLQKVGNLMQENL